MMPILERHEDLGRLPFRYAGIAHVDEPPVSVKTPDPKKSGTGSTAGDISWWALLRFHFELPDDEQTMPPRPVNRVNWQLIISVMSLSITLLTLLVAGAWSLSSKNTNLDTVTATITANSADIRLQRDTLMNLQLEIKGLKDQQQQLLDTVSELKMQVQGKKDK